MPTELLALTDVLDPSAGGPTADLDGLLNRAADLKGELVAFAEHPRLAKHLIARLREAAADHDGGLDEATTVRTIDHFVLQGRLPDGRTVLECFLAQRRPALSGEDRTIVLSWRDVLDTIFEVGHLDGPAIMLHNLLDDLRYRVHSNMGPETLSPLRKGAFVACRIVPLRPATGDWLVSGHFHMFPKAAGPALAKIAVQTLTACPELMRRNPVLWEHAWEMQAEARAAFVELCGADLVVLPPLEAQETLREHYRRLARTAETRVRARSRRHRPVSLAAEELGRLPEEMLAADTVALIYDEVEGLNYYADFGRLDDLFADPSLARDRSYLSVLQGCLRDDTVSTLPIRRLVQRRPDGADPVFRALLRKPGFTWERDGENLLRRYKSDYVDREATPSYSVVGTRLAELLGR